MIPWRHYAKMISLETYLVPIAMTVICIGLVFAFRLFASSQPFAPQVACSFLEGALPLMTALIGNALYFGDPALELNYTAIRPFWRAILERNLLLLGLMMLFSVAFSLAMRAMGLVLPGWGSSELAVLVWLAPGIAWLGVILLFSALMGSAAGGSSLTAMLWVASFFLNGLLRSSTLGHTFYPLLTVFEPDSPTWLLNRAALLMLGVVSFGMALVLLRNSEKYLSSEKG